MPSQDSTTCPPFRCRSNQTASRTDGLECKHRTRQARQARRERGSVGEGDVDCLFELVDDLSGGIFGQANAPPTARPRSPTKFRRRWQYGGPATASQLVAVVTPITPHRSQQPADLMSSDHPALGRVDLCNLSSRRAGPVIAGAAPRYGTAPCQRRHHLKPRRLLAGLPGRTPYWILPGCLGNKQ